MNTPIIDPSTLTEEQRKEIKGYYTRYSQVTGQFFEGAKFAAQGICIALVDLFGIEFFEKGEKE